MKSVYVNIFYTSNSPGVCMRALPVAQLSTDNLCVDGSPAIITYSSPLASIVNLQSTLKTTGSTNQPNGAIWDRE